MINFSLLILCAGFGKRMLELTLEKPKPLLKYKNIILLYNTINFFQNIGCNEFFVNTHYLHKKIQKYTNKEFNNYPLKLIYEPFLLGTGGAIKNIFNYTNNKNICVVNADIFWRSENIFDIQNFLMHLNEIEFCKILLSKHNSFYGLKNKEGDFSIKNGIVSRWKKGDEIIYYSGIQIVNKNIFENSTKIFPMNDVWNKIIDNQQLNGSIMESKILHIGDKNSFDNL